MATEYIVSKNDEKSLGIVGLSTAVFESIASLCLDEIKDVRLADGKTFKKSVSCKVVKSSIVITMNLLVATGVNINEVTQLVQKKAHDAVTQMTSFKDVIINVNVVGFFIK